MKIQCRSLFAHSITCTAVARHYATTGSFKNRPSVSKVYENGAHAGESFGYIFYQKMSVDSFDRIGIANHWVEDSRPTERCRVVKFWLSRC